jgi:hypothetical protein
LPGPRGGVTVTILSFFLTTSNCFYNRYLHSPHYLLWSQNNCQIHNVHIFIILVIQYYVKYLPNILITYSLYPLAFHVERLTVGAVRYQLNRSVLSNLATGHSLRTCFKYHQKCVGFFSISKLCLNRGPDPELSEKVEQLSTVVPDW